MTAQNSLNTVLCGESSEILVRFPANTFSSLVCDPPAGISFDKKWDGDHGGRNNWITSMAKIFQGALRTLKPGAFGLVWALPRTSHWTAWALEMAGFEIKDVIQHVFASGFAKSGDVGRHFDAMGGEKAGEQSPETEDGKKWAGYSSSLKPAAEVWLLVQKPTPFTLAENLAIHGTGALNVGKCRIGPNGQGRLPSNFVLSHSEGCERIGSTKIKGAKASDKSRSNSRRDCVGHFNFGNNAVAPRYADENGEEEVDVWKCVAGCPVKDLVDYENFASRFYYVAKAHANEKDAGLKPGENIHPTPKPIDLMRQFVRVVTPSGGAVLDIFGGSGTTGIAAIMEKRDFVLIEQDPRYCAIARKRIDFWKNKNEGTNNASGNNDLDTGRTDQSEQLQPKQNDEGKV